MSNSMARWAPSGTEGLDLAGSLLPAILRGATIPWYLDKLGILGLWQAGRGAGVTVAVLDSGVAPVSELLGDEARYLDHEGAEIGAGDLVGHGTACASLIASRWKSAPGIAPEARILSIRVCDSDGSPTSDRIVAGLSTALALGCDIASCSFVVERAPPELLEMIRQASARGLVVIAASGNDEAVPALFPEEAPSAVVVAASGLDDQPMAEQRVGDFTDVFAPGEFLRHVSADGLVSTGFGLSSGATALVSGIAALVLSACAAGARAALRTRMKQLVRSCATPLSPFLRAGLIDPVALLSSAVNADASWPPA